MSPGNDGHQEVHLINFVNLKNKIASSLTSKKMNLGIAAELLFGTANYGKPQASPK